MRNGILDTFSPSLDILLAIRNGLCGWAEVKDLS